MKITKKLRDIIKKIANILDTMNPKQKLLVAIVFLAVMYIIAKMSANIVSNSKDDGIDYSSNDGNDFYIFSMYMDDDDTYVLLKQVADDFMLKCQENQTYNGKTITLSDIYSDVLYSDYQDSISKSKFKKVVNTFLEKVNTAYENNIELIPDIVIYNENYYLLKYSYNLEEKVELYIGILLDTSNNKYYVWYLE